MATDAEAAAVTGACFERTATQCDAFSHAGKAVPRAVGRRLRAAVVRYLELELVVAPPQRDPGLGGAGVLERVRQSLLDEAVGGEVDARRQLSLRALHVEVDLEPGLAHGPDQDI